MSRRPVPRRTGVIGPTRRTCKVCHGTGDDGASGDCAFCIRGLAKFGCADCGELLPLCACFDRHGMRQPIAAGGAR